MLLTSQELESIIDLPVSMPQAMIRVDDWLVIATFKLETGQKLVFNNMNLTVIDASIAGVVLPLGNQCSQFNIKLVNNSYGIAYIGIVKSYSVSTDPANVTWIGSAVDVISATSVGVYTRSPTAPSLEITEPGDYSFVLVNNCAASTSSQQTTEVYNVDLRMLVSAQIRLNL